MKDLVKVATRLDALGLTREADVIDALIRKIATGEGKTIEDSYSHSHSEPVSLKSHDMEDFNRRTDAFYEKMRSSGTPMSAMGEHRPYMHELYPSGYKYKPRKPTTQAEVDAILGPADQYGDPARFDLLNQRGVEPEQFSERLHGDSYEMDEDEILSGIDEERELEEEYPAVHSFRR